jgi:hypothetical protein
VIEQIAALIDRRHKVNYKTPDKFIMVDIYQVRVNSAVWMF